MKLAKPKLVVVKRPSDADREAVRGPLKAFNEAAIGLYVSDNVAVLLCDEAGETLGGLWGRLAFDWLYIDLLVVPEAWRGHDLGTDLMREAEQIARNRGCRGVWLSTMAFQARGFYEKLGYAVFGVIEDHPMRMRMSFMSKTL